uniref:OBP40 n=1 Tax=Episyrphus balteatus TaxID=286459 RepID=A0A6H0D4D8_EPIBA|nr:OBP40 [Episyrphus balteatus]
MKFFIIIAFIAIASIANADIPKESDEQFNVAIKGCLEEHKIKEEDYVKLRNGEVANPDENMQCMVNCVMEKTGVLVKGKLQEEVASKIIEKKLGAEEAKAVVNKCKNEPGSGCEVAMNMHLCFLKNKAY